MSPNKLCCSSLKAGLDLQFLLSLYVTPAAVETTVKPPDSPQAKLTGRVPSATKSGLPLQAGVARDPGRLYRPKWGSY